MADTRKIMMSKSNVRTVKSVIDNCAKVKSLEAAISSIFETGEKPSLKLATALQEAQGRLAGQLFDELSGENQS